LKKKKPVDDEDEGFTQFDTKDTPQASQLHRLQSWADVHGNILNEPIAWDTESIEGVPNKIIEFYSKGHKGEFANILPEIDERIQDADREVSLVFEKGNISAVLAKENYEEVDDESVEVAKADEDSELDEVDAAFPQDESVAVVEKVVPAIAKKVAKKSSKKIAVEADDDL